MKMYRTATHLDFYGKTVGFHYEGQDKLRSCTGAILSILVFVLILGFGAMRLGTSALERYQTFSRHELRNHFDGMASSERPDLYAPSGKMSAAQMEALDHFYVGVGYITTPGF